MQPSNKMIDLCKRKIDATKELANIKSIQLELVKHSRLSRNVIKFDKDIASLKGTAKYVFSCKIC